MQKINNTKIKLSEFSTPNFLKNLKKIQKNKKIIINSAIKKPYKLNIFKKIE